MRKSVSILTIIITLVSAGCYYDKSDQVYPQASTVKCDTATMTYTSNIQPLINTYCSGCHTGSITSGIPLASYNAVKNKATAGTLMFRLTTTDPSLHMPQGGPRLSDCELSKVQAWINQKTPQ